MQSFFHSSFHFLQQYPLLIAAIMKPSALSATQLMPGTLSTSQESMRQACVRSKSFGLMAFPVDIADKMRRLYGFQDANVRLIRELREEIDRLKSMLLNFSMVTNVLQEKITALTIHFIRNIHLVCMSAIYYIGPLLFTVTLQSRKDLLTEISYL